MRFGMLAVAGLLAVGRAGFADEENRLIAVPSGNAAASAVKPAVPPPPQPPGKPDIEAELRIFRCTEGFVDSLYPPEPGYLRTDAEGAARRLGRLMEALDEKGPEHRVRHEVERGSPIRRFEFRPEEEAVFLQRMKGDEPSMMLTSPRFELRWGVPGGHDPSATVSAVQTPYVVNVERKLPTDPTPGVTPVIQVITDGLFYRVVARPEADGLIDVRLAAGLVVTDIPSKKESVFVDAGLGKGAATATATVQMPRVTNELVGFRTRMALGNVVVFGPFRQPRASAPPTRSLFKPKALDSREQWIALRLTEPEEMKVVVARPPKGSASRR